MDDITIVKREGRQADPESVGEQPVGSRGLKSLGGQIHEEYQKELRTLRQRVATFAEMSHNPVLGAALFVFETLLAGIEYRVQPKAGNEKNARAVEEATFVADNLKRMKTSWEDFMSEVLTMLVFGFAPMERTFRVGPTGRVELADIALRPQETVFEWGFEGDRLVSLTQQLTMTPVPNQNPTIPIDRVYLFRTSAIKDNPEGRSILRRAYEPYIRGKAHRDLEAIGHERDATGTPIVRVPKEVARADASNAELFARKTAANRIARQIKTGQEVGVVLSSETDPETKQYLYNVELLKSPGERQFDAAPIIDRYNREMLFATLTDVILLGHEKTGAINEGGSGASKDDLLRGGVNSIAERIAEVLNKRAIPELMTFNGVPEELWPEVKPQRLQREIKLSDFVKAIADLAGVGMPIADDPAVENEARGRLRLPLRQGAEAI